MTLRLKRLLADAGITQGELAVAAGLSRPALNALINHGQLPTGCNPTTVRAAITACLAQHGVAYAAWHEQEGPAYGVTPAPISPPQDTDHHTDRYDEEDPMLLRFQALTLKAKRHFGLTINPFFDPASAEEVFLSPGIRYVRESMYQVARHGGFAAVIGESGAGKSTLREDLVDRIQREEQAVIVIQPYVLASEGSDAVGKTLRSHHIAEAIMAAVAPLAKPKSSPEARFRQLHESLRDSGHVSNAMAKALRCGMVQRVGEGSSRQYRLNPNWTIDPIALAAAQTQRARGPQPVSGRSQGSGHAAIGNYAGPAFGQGPLTPSIGTVCQSQEDLEGELPPYLGGRLLDSLHTHFDRIFGGAD